MEKEISLVQFGKALKRKAWLIILLTVVCAIVAYAVSAFLIPPKYTSTSKLYVYNDKGSSSLQNINDINFSKTLVDTYIVILKSDDVLNAVADKLNDFKNERSYYYLDDAKYTPNKIRSMITAKSIDDTPVFSISVTSSNPDEAQFINQQIVDVLRPKLIEIVKAGSVEIVDTPSYLNIPTSPSIPKNTVIGGLLGLIIAVGITFIYLMTDTVIRSEEDLEEAFKNITVLGTIPMMQISQSSQAKGNSDKKVRS